MCFLKTKISNNSFRLYAIFTKSGYNHCGLAVDRVTVYRTLQTFVEKGIIHQVPTTDNSILYALCKHNCEKGHHHDNHVHFVCNQCEATVCLDEVTVPAVKLPVGFRPIQAAMIVTGLCKNCI